MRFSVSLDKLAKILTVIILLLFSFSIYSSLYLYFVEQNVLLLLAAIILAIVFIVIYSFRPIRYTILNGNLTIHRLFNNVEVVKSEIKSVGSINKKKVDYAIRIFGVGGLFGYFGKFSNKKQGVMTWYCTRRDKLVLIITENEKIILSPDDPEAFVTALS